MPTTDGIEATRRLTARPNDLPRILILTTFDLDEYVYDALRAGASGFLLKDVTAERLFDAVRVIAAGDALLAPNVTRRLISEFAQRTANDTAIRIIRPRLSHPTRDRGPQARRRRPLQCRDRNPDRRNRRNREDARQPRPSKTRHSATAPKPS